MGYEARSRMARAGELVGLKVAIDVQHLYRSSHPNDRGTIYTLADRSHVSEAESALIYSAALAGWLRERGAQVLENDPVRGIFVGYYSRRNRAAAAWGAHAYLACHLNAGRGSYCLTEWMAGGRGELLGQAISVALVRNFPAILSQKSVGLHHDERGAVCIERCSPVPALIVEPFFGDNPAQQGLLEAHQLMRIGEVIGVGVSDWWVRDRA